MKKKEKENMSLSDRFDLHKLEMLEQRDKDQYAHEKWEHEMFVTLVTIICMFGFMVLIGLISSSFSNNPKLADYNKLTLGMTYSECKEILGIDGHLIREEENKNTYVWYDYYCSEDKCPVIIELNFENDKLISRSENGLK